MPAVSQRVCACLGALLGKDPITLTIRVLAGVQALGFRSLGFVRVLGGCRV